MYNLQIWYFSYKQLSIVFLLNSIELEPPDFAFFDDDTSDIFCIFLVTHLNNLLIQNDWFGNWSRVAILETLMIFCSIWPVKEFWVVWTWDVIDCNQHGVFIKTVCIPPLWKFEISNFEKKKKWLSLFYVFLISMLARLGITYAGSGLCGYNLIFFKIQVLRMRNLVNPKQCEKNWKTVMDNIF